MALRRIDGLILLFVIIMVLSAAPGTLAQEYLVTATYRLNWSGGDLVFIVNGSSLGCPCGGGPCILYAVVEPGDALVEVTLDTANRVLVHRSVVNATLYSAREDGAVERVCSRTIEAGYNYTILAPGVVVVGNITYPPPPYLGFTVGNKLAVAPIPAGGQGIVALRLPGDLGEEDVRRVISTIEGFMERHGFNYTVNYTLAEFGWILEVEGMSMRYMVSGYAVFSGPPPGPGFSCCNVTFLPEETSGGEVPSGSPILVDAGDVLYVYGGSRTLWVLAYHGGRLYLYSYSVLPGEVVLHWETGLLLNMTFPRFYTTDVIADFLFPYPVNESVQAVDPRFRLVINGRSPLVVTGERSVEETIMLLTPWYLREHYGGRDEKRIVELPVEAAVRGSLEVFVEDISVERVEAGTVEAEGWGFWWLALAGLGVVAAYVILARRKRE